MKGARRIVVDEVVALSRGDLERIVSLGVQVAVRVKFVSASQRQRAAWVIPTKDAVRAIHETVRLARKGFRKAEGVSRGRLIGLVGCLHCGRRHRSIGMGVRSDLACQNRLNSLLSDRCVRAVFSVDSGVSLRTWVALRALNGPNVIPRSAIPHSPIACCEKRARCKDDIKISFGGSSRKRSLVRY